MMSGGVPLFRDTMKLYVFKHEQEVNLSFALSDYLVFKTMFTIDEFEYIIANWNKNEGVQRYDTEHNGRIWWEHRNCGPRPMQLAADFVSIEIKDFTFRISTDAMNELVTDYTTQLANKNHWD